MRTKLGSFWFPVLDLTWGSMKMSRPWYTSLRDAMVFGLLRVMRPSPRASEKVERLLNSRAMSTLSLPA